MRAQLSDLTSPDLLDLEYGSPFDPDNFLIIVEAEIGPLGGKGGDLFSFQVCSSSWMVEEVERRGSLLGRHYLILPHYDYGRLRNTIAGLCDRHQGEDWQGIAARLVQYASLKTTSRRNRLQGD